MVLYSILLYIIYYYTLYIYYYTISYTILFPSSSHSSLLYLLHSPLLSSSIFSSFLFPSSVLSSVPSSVPFLYSSPLPIIFHSSQSIIYSSHSKYTCRVLHILTYILSTFPSFISSQQSDPACFIGVDG